ncbi:MAG TPA: ABC transporter substrate-binding protein [Pyrinomonadaceae bacterium]|nr:ABC transporter substrate-binding protein [Pyrinomonadaceae bacterium]
MKALNIKTNVNLEARGILTCILLFVFAALAGCIRSENSGAGDKATASSTAGGSSKKLRVGFSQMENDGPWRIAETRSMEDEAKKRGIELIVTDARGSSAQQVSDVETLVARKVDAVFLAPREKTGLESALQAAREANIPVFFIDREANGTPGQDFVAFLGSNFIDQGRRAADWLAKTTNGNAKIVEISGSPGASVTQDRARGFKEEIQKFPGMQIIASQTGDFNRAKAQATMENIIQAQGANITAVYTHSDEMAMGAIQALKAAGRKPGQDVVVVSVDGQRSALEAIANGELGATVESNPRFGPLAFDTLEKYKRGEQIPPKVILEDRFFDKSNASQFVAEAY